MNDLLIKNAVVIDGTGSRGVVMDVAVSGGQIVKTGTSEGEAIRVIDAAGHILSPGFIDIHSHSDHALVINPEAHSKVRQGVTTEIVGNCGSSAAPHAKGEEGERGWPDFATYFSALEAQGISVNVAAMVGHCAVRSAVMGLERRPPTKAELAEMKRYVALALEQGAIGFSTGLIYTPSSFAAKDEVVELCREAGRYEGLYSTHLRGEGDTLIDAVQEAIDTASLSGVRTQISHHKAMGRQNWGKVNDTLAMIERANHGGCDITVDIYSYTAGSTNMASLLPPWVHDGGKPAMLARLLDSSVRERLRTEMVEGVPQWSGRLKGTGWENIMVVSYDKDPSVEGKRMSEIADLYGKDPWNTCFDMLIDSNGTVPMCIFSTCEADVETVMKSPLAMSGSDGRALRADGPLAKGKPHPRNYGNFPRLLSEYVRARNVMDLPTAIHKMTEMPARKARLAGRGVIAEGNWADLVVFDPRSIQDMATFSDPHRYPLGIDYVVVNGRVVVDHDRHTGELPGMVLRR